VYRPPDEMLKLFGHLRAVGCEALEQHVWDRVARLWKNE
jgi:hypothetical protein